jgi:hypothetical protein
MTAADELGVRMQNAKDTFYEVLRDRVAAGNAALTVVVRGVVRPAILVDENEIVSAAELRDCFRLRWTSLQRDAEGSAPLVAMQCEIRYATAGTADAGGLDRGRALESMDALLATAVGTAPQSAVKKNFSTLASGGVATELNSRVWWSDVAFGALAEDEAEMRRIATVEVWSYQEVGEA